MKVIIDTNILMASLIADSVIRRMLVSKKVTFCLPEFALEEVEKHKEELKAKAGYSEEEFQSLKKLVMENVFIVPEGVIKIHMKEALRVMKDIDRKDAPFIAAAIAINAKGILSFDKDFSRQKRVKLFGVKEFLES